MKAYHGTNGNLKKLTGHTTDKSFAEFVGVTENTITRAKAGHKTKLDAVLPMLEWLLSALPAELTSNEHGKFKRIFKKS